MVVEDPSSDRRREDEEKGITGCCPPPRVGYDDKSKAAHSDSLFFFPRTKVQGPHGN